MTLPYCDLEMQTRGYFLGRVQNHPSKLPLVLTVDKIDPFRTIAALWECDEEGHPQRPVGSGRLFEGTNLWTGSINEGKANWFLVALKGSCRVEFREKADD